MAEEKLVRIRSVSEVHRMLGLPAPEHPLITTIDFGGDYGVQQVNSVMEMYSIAVKRGVNKMIYGQQRYDFDSGVMGLMAPNQVIKATEHAPAGERSGWIMLVHPDLLWNTPLATKIKQYEFFHYAVHEALFLSEKEEAIINGIVQNIQGEYRANTDKFSSDVIVAQLELLLTYAQRFYERQFITRKKSSSQVLERMEALLAAHFDHIDRSARGLPSAEDIAAQLNLSTKYLSSLLKQLTGRTAQQHIHDKLIEKAKEKLSTTELSVSEIAFQLVFEHSQRFSKLFKSNTEVSPIEFRRAFN